MNQLSGACAARVRWSQLAGGTHLNELLSFASTFGVLQYFLLDKLIDITR